MIYTRIKRFIEWISKSKTPTGVAKVKKVYLKGLKVIRNNPDIYISDKIRKNK